MTEFERGVRFAMERQEIYTAGNAPCATLQFGDYVFSRPERVVELLPRGKEHMEKRIQASLLCAEKWEA